MTHTNPKKIAIRLLKGLFLLFATLFFLPIFYLALLLLCFPETLNGFLFGLAVIIEIISFLFIPFSLYVKTKKKWFWTTAASGVVSGLLILLICYLRTPDGHAAPTSNIHSVFSGSAEFQRTSIANIVPEIEQLKLGTYVSSFFDPLIDSSNSSRIRKLFLNVYREMRESEDFNKMGSVLNLCYLDIFTGKRPTGHFYQYIPKSDSPLPVILFIHGSLGNFKGYMWCWKKFADVNKFAIIAPTFGAGNWDRKGGVEEIEKAVEYCRNNPKFDNTQIYLVGLSNGGKGVSRIILNSPTSTFKGVIYISAVMENEIIAGDSFIAKCKKQNILVVHGEKDRRIPLTYIRPQIINMKMQGVNVEYEYYPDEDHFLMFSQWNHISKRLNDWINNIGVVH